MDLYNPKNILSSSKIYKNKIKFSIKSPDIILAVSVCRSGSTAFLKIFSIGSNMISIYQPIKSILRNFIHDKHTIFNIDKYSDQKTIFIKETLGPYTKIESSFNPYKVLTQNKFPQSKLKVIIIVRKPDDVYKSWIKNWADVRDRAKLLRNLFTGYQTLLKIYKLATRNNSNVSIFVYESIKSTKRKDVFKHMFNKLKITMSKYSIDNWHKIKTDHYVNKIIFPNEPAIYSRKEISNLHDKFNQSKGFYYMTEKYSHVYTSEETKIINKCNKIYKLFNSMSIQDKL